MSRCFNNRWLLLFMMIPFFKPVCFQYFTKFQMLEYIFVIWKIAAAVLIVLLLVGHCYVNLKIPRLIVFAGIFELSIILSTLLHGGYLQRAVIDAVSIAAFTSFLTLGMKYNCRGILYLLSRMLSVLMFMNLASMIVFPGGLPADLYGNNAENPLYFMTIDNGSALFLLFCSMVFTVELYTLEQERVKRQIILIACCPVSAFLSHSGTSILAVLLQMVAFIMLYWNMVWKQIPWKKLFAGYGVFASALILIPQNRLVGIIMTKMFRYSSDLSGRSLLWSVAVNKIGMHFWTGYGRTVQDYIPAWNGYFSSHNIWLELMLQGGVAALVLFFLCISICLLRLEDSQQIKPVKCVIASFFIMMLSAMMESAIHSVYIFGTLVFLYYSRYFVFMREEKTGGITGKAIVERHCSRL